MLMLAFGQSKKKGAGENRMIQSNVSGPDLHTAVGESDEFQYGCSTCL